MILRSFIPTLLAPVISLIAVPAPAADKTTWKPLDAALLKIDDKPVKLWSLYREEKDKHAKRLLLQLGSRFLLIDTESRQVEEFRPESFERHGKDLRSNRARPPAKLLPTSDWILREAGMVRIIHARLDDEGRVVEIQLPSLPDLRY